MKHVYTYKPHLIAVLIKKVVTKMKIVINLPIISI